MTRAELEAHDEAIRGCDLLLARTGWSAVRGDGVRHSHEDPGVSPEACAYLIELPEVPRRADATVRVSRAD